MKIACLLALFTLAVSAAEKIAPTLEKASTEDDTMIRKTTLIRLLASLWITALLPCVHADTKMAPAYLEVSQVADSKELTPAEKVARLRELTRKEETRQMALHHLDATDPATARDEALILFRAADTPRQTKLRMGHFLLEGVRPQQAGFPSAFVAEFARYLVQAILDGGEVEFCQKLEGHPTTAVGEYAYLASDFDGYKGVDFAPFKDARMVPILIRCLDAPDNVYAKEQGCVSRGVPGEPTGRNVARQQIPVALAKLGDASAAKPLETVLFHHADICQRMNAAYALARLPDQKDDRAAIGRKLMEQTDLLSCRLPFGKGLIEAGDDTGVEFLSIKYTGESADRLGYPNELFYHLDRRLDILRGFKSPKVESFILGALDHEPWLNLILFKPGSAKIAPLAYLHPPKDEAEALEICAPRIIRTYAAALECVKLNQLTPLTGKLQEIAKQTRNETIRQMTEDCLNAIR